MNPSSLDRRVLAACDAAGAFIEYWGFKAIHGRVWTLVAISRAPLSQTEVAERLGVSRSLVSQAVADLESRGLLRQAGEGRKAPLQAVWDVWPVIADVLRKREWQMLDEARLSLEAALEEAELSPAGDIDPGRVRVLLSMTEIAQTFVGVLIALRVPASVEKVADWMGRARLLVQTLRGVG